jgi:colicin import membrane protein
MRPGPNRPMAEPGHGAGTGAGAVHDALMPPAPGGTAQGAALSLLVHGGLVAALAWGVAWRSPPPVTVSAELWAAVPQEAAPPAEQAPPPAPTPAPPPPPPPPPAPAPAPPPPPPPREADIAVEKAKQQKALQEKAAQEQADKAARAAKAEKAAREKAEKADRDKAEKAERDKAAKEKQAREAAQRKREEETQKKLDEQERNKQLERTRGQLLTGSGTPGSSGTAAVDAATSTGDYAGLINKAVRSQFRVTDKIPESNSPVVVLIRVTSNGTIISSRVVQTSGHRDWDEAVLRAFDRMGTLPRDNTGKIPEKAVVEGLRLTYFPR